jgi:hypothetical protein
VRRKLKKQPNRSASKARSFVAPGPLPVSVDLLTAGVQVELDADLELDRQRRAEALKAKLTRMLAQGDGAAAIDQMMSLMLEMERTNDRLAWRVLLANRYRFGRQYGEALTRRAQTALSGIWRRRGGRRNSGRAACAGSR